MTATKCASVSATRSGRIRLILEFKAAPSGAVFVCAETLVITSFFILTATLPIRICAGGTPAPNGRQFYLEG
jgi:hypothetical protein